MKRDNRGQCVLNRGPRHGAAALIAVAACLVCLAVLPGCGPKYGAGVSGTATLDGEPLPRGTVTFEPVGGGAFACAEIAPDGTFEVQTGANKSLAPGDYHVTVVAFSQFVGPGMTPEQVEAVRIAPKKYASKETSGLKFTVAPGANQFDLVLKRD